MNSLPSSKSLGAPAPVAAPPPDTEHLPTIAALTSRLGCTQRKCAELLRTGQLRSINDGAGATTYLTSDLDAVMDPEHRKAKLEAEFNQSVDAVTARIDAVLERLEHASAAKRGDLRFRLSATTIDTEAGVIFGVTCAKSGVTAAGKFIYLDRAGGIVKDASQAVRKIPVATDDETLSTLLTAAEAAGGRVKTRNDHADDLSARAGYAENFRKVGDRVTCDLHLLDGYADRALFLEIAERTPELAGLSIDFRPTFEIKGDFALMRVAELIAVDLVDAGAITADGLFA